MTQTQNVFLLKYTKNFLNLNGFNPFLNIPEFQNIWPSDSLKIAMEATQEALDDGEDNMYLIAISELESISYEDLTFIGVTGFFNNSIDGSQFSLRWHGILPEYRGFGYSERALNSLKNIIIKSYPSVQYIQEFIPQDSSREYLFQYFKKIGFTKFGELEFPEWSSFPIQQLRIKI